jgi:DNA-binding GntR family transcriptional regulator
VPDVRRLPLRAAISILADRGCLTTVHGSGFVVAQDPAPASPLAAGQTCSITLEEAKTGAGARAAASAPPSPAARVRGQKRRSSR